MSTYYFVPSRNVFGEGSVVETGELMKSLGGSKAMIVTDEFLAKDIGQIHYGLDQKVWAIIDQDKINIYNKETTRLIKRAV